MSTRKKVHSASKVGAGLQGGVKSGAEIDEKFLLSMLATPSACAFAVERNRPAEYILAQKLADIRKRFENLTLSKGICPVGCASCEKDGEMSSNWSYSPTPVNPGEKNCVRCSFFLTGPAFIDGLLDHASFLSAQLRDASERNIKLQQDVKVFEDEKSECSETGRPFTRFVDFEKTSRSYEAAAEKCNKLGEDLHATICLVIRSIDMAQHAVARHPQFSTQIRLTMPK